jgi:uncharacterized protein DUF3891
MIVRLTGSSQFLITQPDHATLAATIMRGWRTGGLLDSPRLAAILLAIEQHDNGWSDVDAAPLVDEQTGDVVDFVAAPAEIRRALWPRGADRLASTPYAAALVAQHAVHVYRRYRGNPDWAQFFLEMESRRDRYRDRAAVTPDDLMREYFFLRIGDLASLTFCNGWTDPQVDDSGSGYTVRLDGPRLTIAPDPFGGHEVRLEIAARELPRRAFRSAAEAREAFRAAEATVIVGVAIGG